MVDDDAVPMAQARAIQPGGAGQLLVRGVRGLSLFQEYLGNDAATQASYTEDGWFRTGHRVDGLAEGALRFADRSKDMLKVGGENVAACEIEPVLADFKRPDELRLVDELPRSRLEKIAKAQLRRRPEAQGPLG